MRQLIDVELPVDRAGQAVEDQAHATGPTLRCGDDRMTQSVRSILDVGEARPLRNVLNARGFGQALG